VSGKRRGALGSTRGRRRPMLSNWPDGARLATNIAGVGSSDSMTSHRSDAFVRVLHHTRVMMQPLRRYKSLELAPSVTRACGKNRWAMSCNYAAGAFRIGRLG
jgi:hypothetical protein